jgi:hypothetical protein
MESVEYCGYEIRWTDYEGYSCEYPTENKCQRLAVYKITEDIEADPQESSRYCTLHAKVRHSMLMDILWDTWTSLSNQGTEYQIMLNAEDKIQKFNRDVDDTFYLHRNRDDEEEEYDPDEAYDEDEEEAQVVYHEAPALQAQGNQFLTAGIAWQAAYPNLFPANQPALYPGEPHAAPTDYQQFEQLLHTLDTLLPPMTLPQNTPINYGIEQGDVIP